jgi:hypothetical protein
MSDGSTSMMRCTRNRNTACVSTQNAGARPPQVWAIINISMHDNAVDALLVQKYTHILIQAYGIARVSYELVGNIRSFIFTYLVLLFVPCDKKLSSPK